MKKLSIISIITAATLFSASCKKDFGETNTDPSVVTTPDVAALFAYSAENLESYQGQEWVWENLEQLLRFSQHLTTDPYELSNNVNSRYRVLYNNILPNLVEIRNYSSGLSDGDRYRNIRAATYIVGILQALKTTDMNGSLPYSQAIKARQTGELRPAYDPQKQLFDTWLDELSLAIDSLAMPAANQIGFGASDIYYANNWLHWAKLANTLKLRIAVRYERADVNVTKRIFREVMTSAEGPIDSDASQFKYDRPTWNPSATISITAARVSVPRRSSTS